MWLRTSMGEDTGSLSSWEALPKFIFLQGLLASVLPRFWGHSYILDGSKNCTYDWLVPVFTCRHWAMKLAGPTTPPLQPSHAKWPAQCTPYHLTWVNKCTTKLSPILIILPNKDCNHPTYIIKHSIRVTGGRGGGRGYEAKQGWML